MKGQRLIEEVYDIALNPNLDYFAQLEPLAANGELANHVNTSKILFKLCQLVDAQEKRIKALEDTHEEITKRILEISGKHETEIDATKPLT